MTKQVNSSLVLVCSEIENRYDIYFIEIGLDENLFQRCHRSYLINLSKVRKIIKREGGYLQIGDDMIPIGRQHYAKIMSIF